MRDRVGEAFNVNAAIYLYLVEDEHQPLLQLLMIQLMNQEVFLALILSLSSAVNV